MAVHKSNEPTKDGRSWYFSVRYKDVSGNRDRYKSKKYHLKSEAQEEERAFLLKVKSIIHHISFNDLYELYLDWCESSIKEATIFCKKNRITNHVLSYFGRMDINDITVFSVTDWKNQINKKTIRRRNKKTGIFEERQYSISFRKSLYKELSVILGFGYEFYGLEENVTKKARNFKDKNEEVVEDDEPIKYITSTEYNFFISVVTDIIFKTFFAFLYYMGVRKGEAQALTWRDILWDIHKVRISKTFSIKTEVITEYGTKGKVTNTKNRKSRTIKIPAILESLLRELYDYYEKFEGFSEDWFVFGGHRHLPSQTIDNNKDRAFELANATYNMNIQRITCHEFRHSHATYLYSKGVKLRFIAFRLGDTEEVVTRVYAHLYPETEDEAINELNLIENQIENKLFINHNQETNNEMLEIPALKKEFLELPTRKKTLSNC